MNQRPGRSGERDRPGGQNRGIGQQQIATIDAGRQIDFAAQCFQIRFDAADDTADAGYAQPGLHVDQVSGRHLRLHQHITVGVQEDFMPAECIALDGQRLSGLQPDHTGFCFRIAIIGLKDGVLLHQHITATLHVDAESGLKVSHGGFCAGRCTFGDFTIERHVAASADDDFSQGRSGAGQPDQSGVLSHVDGDELSGTQGFIGKRRRRQAVQSLLDPFRHQHRLLLDNRFAAVDCLRNLQDDRHVFGDGREARDCAEDVFGRCGPFKGQHGAAVLNVPPLSNPATFEVAVIFTSVQQQVDVEVVEGSEDWISSSVNPKH